MLSHWWHIHCQWWNPAGGERLVSHVSVVVKSHFVFPVISEPGELVWLLGADLW